MAENINVAGLLTKKKKKVKRGGKKRKNQSLVMFSINAAGLKSKLVLKMRLKVS